jgi:hypothetical protein
MGLPKIMNIINKSWVNVAVFENQIDAQKLEKFLQLRCIEARTQNDRWVQIICFLCPPHATWRTQVRLADLLSVEHMLDIDPEGALVTERALHCPACASLRVQYPQMTRRFLSPAIFLDLGVLFRVIDHEACCEQCQNTWRLPKTQPGLQLPSHSHTGPL